MRVAVDELAALLALKSVPGGVMLAGNVNRPFEKSVLYFKETVRPEVASAFQPSLIEQGTVVDVRLVAENVFRSVWLNPGCAFDTREATTEVTLSGSEIVYVDMASDRSATAKVLIEGGLSGVSALVISLPKGLSLRDA